MRLRSRVVPVLLCLVLLASLAALGIRLTMGRAESDQIAEGEIVDFAALTPQHHRFLMCPPHFCSATPDAESPVFALGWEQLRDAWSEMMARQPRLKLVAGDGDLDKITYIQHGALLQAPDIVTIQLVPLGAGKSSFAIASASRYGVFDFGENRRRVLAWTARLQRMIKDRSKR